MNTQRIILFVCTAIGLIAGIIGMMSDIDLWSGNPMLIWCGIGVGVALSYLIAKISDIIDEGFGMIPVWFILLILAGPIGFFIRFRQTRD